VAGLNKSTDGPHELVPWGENKTPEGAKKEMGVVKAITKTTGKSGENHNRPEKNGVTVRKAEPGGGKQKSQEGGAKKKKTKSAMGAKKPDPWGGTTKTKRKSTSWVGTANL